MSKKPKVVLADAPLPEPVKAGAFSLAPWPTIFAAEENQNAVSTLVGDLIAGVFGEIHNRELDRQLHTHVARRMRSHIMGLVEQCSVRIDAGESPATDSSWWAGDEPAPCLVDSWARGCVPVQATLPPPPVPALGATARIGSASTAGVAAPTALVTASARKSTPPIRPPSKEGRILPVPPAASPAPAAAGKKAGGRPVPHPVTAASSPAAAPAPPGRAPAAASEDPLPRAQPPTAGRAQAAAARPAAAGRVATTPATPSLPARPALPNALPGGRASNPLNNRSIVPSIST